MKERLRQDVEMREFKWVSSSLDLRYLVFTIPLYASLLMTAYSSYHLMV
jgi:hypothetical protein